MTYRIEFHNDQGVLMRVLNEVTRRAIVLDYVWAHKGVLILTAETSHKQDGQLRRTWKSIIGVQTVV